MFLDARKIFLIMRENFFFLAARVFFLAVEKFFAEKRTLRREKNCFVTISRKEFLASEKISIGVLRPPPSKKRKKKSYCSHTDIRGKEL